jgi:hypothetical protein
VERLADTIDLEIKYGGGPEAIRDVLIEASDTIAGFERIEISLRDLRERSHAGSLTEGIEAALSKLKRALHEALARTIFLEEEAARKS